MDFFLIALADNWTTANWLKSLLTHSGIPHSGLTGFRSCKKTFYSFWYELISVFAWQPLTLFNATCCSFFAMSIYGSLSQWVEKFSANAPSYSFSSIMRTHGEVHRRRAAGETLTSEGLMIRGNMNWICLVDTHGLIESAHAGTHFVCLQLVSACVAWLPCLILQSTKLIVENVHRKEFKLFCQEKCFWSAGSAAATSEKWRTVAGPCRTSKGFCISVFWTVARSNLQSGCLQQTKQKEGREILSLLGTATCCYISLCCFFLLIHSL